MANAVQAPKIQLGKLTPEDAERLASTFRPVWELDDAPFTSNGAQGNGLSAADIDALGAGAGIAPSVRQTEAIQARPPQPEPSTSVSATTEIKSVPPGHVPAMHDPKVEISIDVEPDSPPVMVAPVIAQAQPQPVAAPAPRPYVPPRAPPPTVRVNRDAAGSGEFVPVKKSNTGLIIGAVGVLVLVGAVFGIRAAMSGDKPTSATSSTSTATHEEAHIPPPPPDTATVGAQAPTQTAQQQAQAPQPPPQSTQAAPHDTTTTHQTTASNVTAPVHNAATGGGHATTTATHPTGGGGGGTKPGGHTAIVRDNPF